MIFLPGKYNVSEDYRVNHNYDPWVVTLVDYSDLGMIRLAVEGDYYSALHSLDTANRYAKREGWEYAGLP